MPASKKPAPRSQATAADRARAEDNVRRLDHVAHSLDAAQKDLAAIGGSLGTGARDLQRDVSRLLRDARRDLTKMSRAVQRDLDRLQRDLAKAATAATAKPPTAATAKPPTAGTAKPPAPRRAAAGTTRTAKRQTAASSH